MNNLRPGSVTLLSIFEATLALRKMKDEFQANCEHTWRSDGSVYSTHHTRVILQCAICNTKGMFNNGVLEETWNSYRGKNFLQFSEEE